MRWNLSPLVIVLGCCLTTGLSARPQSSARDEVRWRSDHDKGLDAMQQGRFPEAASLFLEAAALAEQFGKNDARLAESLNGLAQVYRYQQNYDEAETRALQSLTILERAFGPSHSAVIPSLVNLAGIKASAGRYSEAEQVYRRILSIRWGAPGDEGPAADQVLEDFAQVLSLNLAGGSGLERAFDKYWRSISDSRLNKDLYLAMRDRLMEAQLIVEAESLMQRAVHMYPDSRQLQYQLGELYMFWGKYQKAIEAFEGAARRRASPAPEVEHQQRGVIYERIGEMNFYLVRFDEAFAALAKALEINPASWSPRLLLGALHLRRNRFEEAAAEYSRVISANSQIAAAYDGLAQVDLALGRYTNSAREASRALAVDPGLQSARYTKAMALIRGGDEQEGRNVLQDYQQRESELEAAKSKVHAITGLSRTSSAMLSETRVEEAMALLEAGIRTYPNEAGLYLKLGLTQSRLGLHREAAETLETMVRLQLDDFLVHRQLALEYEQLGNKQGSQQQRVLYLQKYNAALQTKTN